MDVGRLNSEHWWKWYKGSDEEVAVGATKFLLVPICKLLFPVGTLNPPHMIPGFLV